MNLFEVSLESLNLFSFMLGMTFAFFKQGLFGKRIGKYLVLYFGCMIVWYWFGAHYYNQEPPGKNFESSVGAPENKNLK